MKKKISLPPNYFYFSIMLIIPFRYLIPGLNLIPILWNLSGLLVMAVGLYLIWKPYKQFMDHNTPENFGTSTCIVSDGLYRYSRNPMYVGGVIFLVGLAVLLQNVAGFISAIFFFLVMHYMFIPYEEEKMVRECGNEYSEYMKTVRRWI